MGSTTSITDGTQSVQSSYRYNAFGGQTRAAGSVPNNNRYISKEWDDTTGLNLHWARYLDPAIGRFISKDPAGMVDGTNLYTYAGDNPVNFVDPSGLADKPWDLSELREPACKRLATPCAGSSTPTAPPGPTVGGGGSGGPALGGGGGGGVGGSSGGLFGSETCPAAWMFFGIFMFFSALGIGIGGDLIQQFAYRAVTVWQWGVMWTTVTQNPYALG